MSGDCISDFAVVCQKYDDLGYPKPCGPIETVNGARARLFSEFHDDARYAVFRLTEVPGIVRGGQSEAD